MAPFLVAILGNALGATLGAGFRWRGHLTRSSIDPTLSVPPDLNARADVSCEDLFVFFTLRESVV
jgi:hypothetical protein